MRGELNLFPACQSAKAEPIIPNAAPYATGKPSLSKTTVVNITINAVMTITNNPHPFQIKNISSSCIKSDQSG
ncbi:hypothetical protein CPter91_2259 [Collimonas pratensis]|uniref:Uncharacterized protein n=1 Tax=Collimonas pratensis TaxID=279113 RepID=A0A127Q3L8_9BURK|nr:hypothetical protein CPter91_2259 [Collimonas pratensis]